MTSFEEIKNSSKHKKVFRIKLNNRKTRKMKKSLWRNINRREEEEILYLKNPPLFPYNSTTAENKASGAIIHKTAKKKRFLYKRWENGSKKNLIIIMIGLEVEEVVLIESKMWYKKRKGVKSNYVLL